MAAAVGAYSQNVPTAEVQKLNQQIIVLHQQEKFDEAVPLAEKVIDAVKKNGNAEDSAAAYLNLAALHKQRFQVNRAKALLSATPDKERIKAFAASRDAGDKAKRFLNEVIKIGETKIKTESAQVAAAQRELAWMFYNYKPGFDARQQQDRIEKAEKFYKQALETHQKLLGFANDATLLTVVSFAEYYHFFLEIEKAAPLYEQFLKYKQEKVGANDKSLVPILWASVDILITTDRQDEAAKIVERISAITEQKQTVPEASNELSLRVLESDRYRLRKNTRIVQPRRVLSGAPAEKLEWEPITFKILVDENGKVVAAESDSTNQSLTVKAEKIVRQIKFKPFIYNNVAYKLKGKILYSEFEFTSK